MGYSIIKRVARMITRSRSRSTESSPPPSLEPSVCDSAPLEETDPSSLSEKTKKKKSGRGFLKRRADQWVGVLPSSSQDSDQHSLSIVSLKNPSSGK